MHTIGNMQCDYRYNSNTMFKIITKTYLFYTEVQDGYVICLTYDVGVSFVAQWLTNPISIHDNEGLIPGLI